MMSKLFITIRANTKKGYEEAYEGDCINLEQPNSKTRRGRVGKQVSQTITTSPQLAVIQEIKIIRYKGENIMLLKIRKLTPLECFRLMGFDDEDYLAAEKVNSNSQLYKQAGNSIVVDVIEEIYEQLFSIYWSEIK